MDKMHDRQCRDFEKFLKLYLNLRLAADYLCREESVGTAMLMLKDLKCEFYY